MSIRDQATPLDSLRRPLQILGRPGETRGTGQALVEFALVIPLFIFLLLAVIEFALVLHAVLVLNFATREASLIAAEAGSAADADCLILQTLDSSVDAPANAAQIQQVRIFRADRAGAPIPGDVTTYTRGGTTSCTLPGGALVTLPYAIAGGAGYPPAERCNILAGCGGARSSLDQIGVEATYRYQAHTPIASFFTSAGISIQVKGNVMRMEPVL